MSKIMLLEKQVETFIARDVETGLIEYESNMREFVLENAIEEARILIIDDSFKKGT